MRKANVRRLVGGQKAEGLLPAHKAFCLASPSVGAQYAIRAFRPQSAVAAAALG